MERRPIVISFRTGTCLAKKSCSYVAILRPAFARSNRCSKKRESVLTATSDTSLASTLRRRTWSRWPWGWSAMVSAIVVVVGPTPVTPVRRQARRGATDVLVVGLEVARVRHLRAPHSSRGRVRSQGCAFRMHRLESGQSEPRVRRPVQLRTGQVIAAIKEASASPSAYLRATESARHRLPQVHSVVAAFVVPPRVHLQRAHGQRDVGEISR